MRIRACLVCIAVLVMVAPSLVMAGEAAGPTSSAGLSVASARDLPAISALAHDPLQNATAESGAPEIFEEPPLDDNILLLAAWLPIAAALLALAMESTSPAAGPAREPGRQPSLD